MYYLLTESFKTLEAKLVAMITEVVSDRKNIHAWQQLTTTTD